MTLLILVLAAISLYGIGIRRGSSPSFLSRDFCDSVKGVCIVLVFIRHIWPYVTASGCAEPSFLRSADSFANAAMGQLMVAPFLFFSGYGMMEQTIRKGPRYVARIPFRRILSTLLNFDIAVLSFAALRVALGLRFPASRFALALVGWSDIGNSNWYVFDILVLYAIFWIAFTTATINRVSGTENRDSRTTRLGFANAAIATTLLTIAFAVCLRRLGKNGYWYNTLLCFPAGIWFSILSPFLHKINPKTRMFFGFAGAALITLCVAKAIGIYHPNAVAGNVAGIAISICVALASMRIDFGNTALRWMGRHLFPMYIFQRLPMIALVTLDNGHFAAENPWLYVSTCFATTLAIAAIWPRLAIKID